MEVRWKPSGMEQLVNRAFLPKDSQELMTWISRVWLSSSSVKHQGFGNSWNSTASFRKTECVDLGWWFRGLVFRPLRVPTPECSFNSVYAYSISPGRQPCCNRTNRTLIQTFSLYFPITSDRRNKSDTTGACSIYLRDVAFKLRSYIAKINSTCILGNDQLDAQLLGFTIGLLCSSTCFEHCMLIIRRLNCTDAASGIVTIIKWLSGAQVERDFSLNLCPDTQLLRVTIRFAVSIQFYLLMMNIKCSKHLEEHNKRIVK
jgi:hypothetical protein